MGYTVENIPLADFYEQFKPELARSGFSALIMALIRDADAPSFYDDVVRYWTSLSDVTGGDIIFLVAGDRPPTLESKLAIRYGSGQVETEALVTPTRYDSGRYGWGSVDLSISRTPRDRAALADRNTQQVGQLSKKLRISEKDVPCFYIEILAPVPARGIISARELIEYGTYHIVKRIVETLWSLFESWGWHQNHRRHFSETARRLDQLEMDRLVARRLLAEFQVVTRELDRHKSSVNQALVCVRTAAADLQPIGQAIVSNIITNCYDERRSVEEKKHLLFLARRASRQGDIDLPTKRAIDELIKASFSKGHLRLLDAQHQREYAHKRHEAQFAVDKIESGYEECRSELEHCKNFLQQVSCELNGKSPDVAFSAALADLNREFNSGVERSAWNYFISYPAADRRKAIELFQRYSVAGPTFMDWFCLKPGDEWLKKIPEVQSKSEATVALVTHNTAKAHFQLSEINRAINFARTGKHRVIPHITSRQIELPFGLELYHAEVIDSE